ncbi:type III pantothenate kinase [Echinicola strongylocentroti]|uniref:Type III pantothenate kinase n=1 Tax=Echinicola strongylocentroti TaxID=1795355 RepID=A0A2Z4IJG5_9BACT|nr:type III pantothenate kinase [Echinicola strongylocentroti]AWW30889.1 type III pantothenate kinase [Echinicola strongylocentroti]
MFLSIDAGNSNVVFGFYDPRDDQWEPVIRLETQRAMELRYLQKNVDLFFLESSIKPTAITGVGISSVVPEINENLKKVVKSSLHQDAHLITERSYRHLPVTTKRPAEMGSDLMANAAAAYHHYQSHCIVVDFGTALTFTVIDGQGEVLGVNIVPGLKTALKSLFMNTSKLPEVSLEVPDSAIGKNTVHSIQAGILYGYAGLVKGMLQAIRNEVPENFKIVATGGLSKILTNLKGEFDQVDKNLTLKGIKLITEHNS